MTRVFRTVHLASIACVRPSDSSHKTPGETPIAPGPPRQAHLDRVSASPVPEPSSAAGATAGPPKTAPAQQPDAEEFDDPPPRSSRLLHPSTISLLLALVVLATCAINNVRDRVQRSALEQALAPLQKEWATLREQAGARMAGIEPMLGASGSPREDSCASLTGAISVIHRPMLSELAAGATAPRPGPLWLNSDAWLYLALALTPGHDVDAYHRRNEVVRRAIAQPCIGILDAEQATGAQAVAAHRFAGGEVSGRLRIVCFDEARVACEVAIVSQPTFAVSVVQRNERAQSGADAAAISDSATRAYWQAAEVAVAARAPGLRVERAPDVTP